MLGGFRGVKAAPSVRVGLSHRSIGRLHSGVKGERFGFEAVPARFGMSVLACQPDLDWQIEEYRHVWLETGGGEGYHRDEILSVKTSTGALIGERRIGKSVTHDDLAAL
jgi:hypothetical protein